MIAALWLLILGGSIAAVLMLRGLGEATAAAGRGAATAHKLALEGAIETVMADRLFHGARSVWWLVPHRASVMFGKESISVKITSESDLLDINEADLVVIDAAIHEWKVATNDRPKSLQGFRSAEPTSTRSCLAPNWQH